MIADLLAQKEVAIYRYFTAQVPVWQRYIKWIYHRTGSKAGEKWYKRRAWKKTKRTKKIVKSGRYELQGRGRNLLKAVILAHRLPPKPEKPFVNVKATKFLEDPYRFIILKSSERSLKVKSNRKIIFTLNNQSFHVVFNRPAKDWTENV